MLVDVKLRQIPEECYSLKIRRIARGVYLTNISSLDLIADIPKDLDSELPVLENINCYGVCDNLSQILEQCPELEKSKRQFVLTLIPVRKKDQPSIQGWRWHKWGPYIGSQKSRSEYLYDEPTIKKVYIYHIRAV